MSVKATTSAPAPRRWRAFAIALIAIGALCALASPAIAASGGAGTGGNGTGGNAKTPVRQPGDVDLVRLALERRQPLADHRQGPPLGHRHRLHQVRRRQRHLGQFNQRLVDRLHRGGLDVCAWQFVYGNHPVGEAKVGAASVRRGADCLVIDAEGDYEGRYAVRRPLHPGAAPARSAPPSRSRWRASPTSTTTRPSPTRSSSGRERPASTSRRCTGTRSGPRSAPSTSTPTSTTASGAARSSRSGRPTQRVSLRSLKLFRRFALTYGGGPPSWWDWQETNARQWALARPPDRRAGPRLPAGHRACPSCGAAAAATSSSGRSST